jgi:hypothetical protein
MFVLTLLVLVLKPQFSRQGTKEAVSTENDWFG